MKNKIVNIIRWNIILLIFVFVLFYTHFLNVSAVEKYIARVGSQMYSDYEEAWEDAVSSGQELTMISNWEITGVLSVDSNKIVNLNMNGYMINRGRTSSTSSGQVFLVNSSATLNIYGGGDREHKGVMLSTGVWSSNENGKHIIYGSLITGGYNSNGGGAIHIQENATVNLNQVSVAGNATSDSNGGGGVRLQGTNSTLKLYDSSILYNYSSGSGGAGIRMEGTGAYVEINNSCIKYNVTNGSSSDGGGIYINNGNVVVSNNSEISYNTSTRNGGGIHLNKGDLVVSDSSVTISYNIANNGGAVYVGENAIQAVLSGSFIGNSAKEKGGAIFINQKNPTQIKEANFYGNISRECGGAVYVDADDFVSFGGTISMNGNTPNGLYLTSPRNVTELTLYEGSLIGLDTSFDMFDNSPLRVGALNAAFFMSDKEGYNLNIVNDNSICFTKEEIVDVFNSYIVNRHTYELKTGNFLFEWKGVSNLKAKYYYSDGYFHDSPVMYNEHLATMSMNFALSAMNSYLGGREYTEENAAENAVNLLKALGFSNFYIHYPSPEFYGIDAETISTIGYIIASKTITINNEDVTLIAVSVRGGGYGVEWASNVILGDGVGEAKGFCDAANQVEKGIEEYLSIYNIDTSQSKFWLTGFSRSAATANLTSKRLTDKYGKDRVYSYCFETPKGGVLSLINKGSDYSNIHNIISKSDAVIMVGPSEMGFIRYGVDHVIPANKVGTDEYNVQKDKMLLHLSSINEYISYDDYYHAATLEYFDSYITGSNLIQEVDWNYSTVEDFLPFFISQFQKRSLTDKSKDNEYNYESKDWQGYRHYYSSYKWYLKEVDGQLKIISYGTAPSDYIGNESSYIALTIEEAIVNLLEMFYSMTPTQQSAITKNISMESIKEDLSMFDVWTEVIDEWEHFSIKNKNSWLTKIWKALKVDTVPNDIISAEQKAHMKSSAYVALDLLLDFVGEDYEHNDQNGLGTMVYNISGILQNHDHSVVVSWLRSYDSFYLVDYIAPPQDPLANIEEGIYKESLDLKLSSDTDKAKIYYTLDGTLPVIGSENTFEYTGNIHLPFVDNSIKKYIINAVAIVDEIKSTVSTYRYYVSDDNEFITDFVVSNISYGDEPKVSVDSVFGDVVYLYSTTIDGEYSKTIPTIPGIYFVKAIVEGSSFYEQIETEVKTFTINKKEIDLSRLTWTEDSFVYDNTKKEVVLEGIELESGLFEIVYENNVYTNAGHYTATADIVLMEPEFYTLVNGSLTHDWVIEVATNEFSVSVDTKNWIYNEQASTPVGEAKFGVVIFKYSKEITGEYSEEIPTEVGTYYVKGFVVGSDNYTGLESESVLFTINQATNEFIVDVTIDSWEYGQTVSPPQGEVKFGQVIFVYSNAIYGEYKVEVPTTPGHYYLKAYVEGNDNYSGLESEPFAFEIYKMNNMFTKELTVSNWTYGEKSNIQVGSLYGEVELLYSSSVDGDYSLIVPMDAGSYFVKAVVFETLYYSGLESIPVEFKILKDENEFINEVSINSWIYGETPSIPTATTKYGVVTFKYSIIIDGEYLDVQPVDAGTYYLKACVEEAENYEYLEKIVQFEIKKAEPIVSVPNGLTAKKGSLLSSVKLPDNWHWNDPSLVLDTTGKTQVKATYIPEDINNYNVVEMLIEIDVKVKTATIVLIISSVATLIVGTPAALIILRKKHLLFFKKK